MSEDYGEGSSGAGVEGGAGRGLRTRIVRKLRGGSGSSGPTEPGPTPAEGSWVQDNKQDDRESYQGFGFNGRCVGEITLPSLVAPSPAAEAESDTLHEPEPAVAEASALAFDCRTCNSQMTLLPNRRLWCSRCKAFSEVRDGSVIATVGTVIAIGLLLVLAALYVRGEFDNVLYVVGFNWETCGLSQGEVLCGDEALVGTDVVGRSIKDSVWAWFQ